MPTHDDSAAPKPTRLGVYVTTPEEAARAKEILRRVDPDVHEYHGQLTGFAIPETLRELCDAGLMVVSSSPAGNDPLPEPTPVALADVVAPGAAAPTARDLDARKGLLESLEQRARSQPLRESAADAGEAMFAADAEPAPPPGVYEVQLLGPMRPEWADELKRLQIAVSSYVFPYTYRMALTPDQLAAISKAPFVRGEPKRYGIDDTVTPEFLAEMGEAEQEHDSAPKLFDLTVHRTDQVETISRLIQAQPDAELVQTAGKSIRFSAPITASFMAALADRDEVKLLTPYKPVELFVDKGRQLLGLPTMPPAAQANPNPWPWDGADEVVGIIDSGIDATHPDFKAADGSSRVIAKAVAGATVDDLVGHGTHVAGIIGGNGAASQAANAAAAGAAAPAAPAAWLRGMAPAAKLVMLGIVKDGSPLLPPDLSPLLEQVTAEGASIVNASLGTRLSGRYDSYSESVDQFIWDHPEVLVVIAAGNDGSAQAGYPDYRSLGTPASAKNALTVGACSSSRDGFPIRWDEYNAAKYADPFGALGVAGDPDRVAGLSSRGPTDFESIKPDVVAPGTYIVSTKAVHAGMRSTPYPGSDRYMYLSGTSMAAPFVSGAAAVLRHYLRDRCALPHPSAALLKAILCASTRRCNPMINPALQAKFGYPDFDQGLGRVDLAAVLPHTDAQHRRIAFLDVPNDAQQALLSRQPPGGTRLSTRSYKITVPAGAGPLCVVLVWTDLPGRGLQNTLQLDVKGPGVGLVGNHDHLWKKDDDLPVAPDRPAPVPFDRVNNVQVAWVKEPAAGDYTISVHADNTTVPGKAQGYALCVRGTLGSDLVALDP